MELSRTNILKLVVAERQPKPLVKTRLCSCQVKYKHIRASAESEAIPSTQTGDRHGAWVGLYSEGKSVFDEKGEFSYNLNFTGML